MASPAAATPSVAIHADEQFTDAVKHYLIYLGRPRKIVPLDALSKEEFPHTVDLVAVHAESEKDMLQMARRLRASPGIGSRPIMFWGPALSNYGQLLCRDLESIVTFTAPFSSAGFLGAATKVYNLIDRLGDYFNDRQTVTNLFAQKNYEESLVVAQRIADNSKTFFRGKMLQAQAHLALGQTSETIEALKLALEQRKDTLDGRLILADAYRRQLQFAKARGVLERSTQYCPHHLPFLIRLGDIALDEGDSEGARRAYLGALRRDPMSVDAKTGLLATEYASGNIDAADQIRRGEFAKSLDLPRMCNDRAMFLVRSGNYQGAERIYKVGLAHLKDEKSAFKFYLNLGICMKKAKDWRRAWEYFLLCEKLAPRGYDKIKEHLDWLREYHPSDAPAK